MMGVRWMRSPRACLPNTAAQCACSLIRQARIKEKLEKKQGHRMRKEGAKANKFDAEAAGKKANKKNGLMH